MSPATVEQNVFVSQGAHQPISEEDMRKLIDSLKLDASDNELRAMLESVRQQGGTIDKEQFQVVLTSMLADGKHLGELTGSIGEFDIDLR
ncbi:hypothetical protein DFQ28_009994 [Apophysomyces sp. BC1034]|nr:hypothetical protein DFQ30_005878 [Apophysomyces sp. BC1015]KAG0174644.1 hypothetical protein DFQ29_007415 [Apophysomyces sp. BC1021]KAG0185062.1 hypothetical protein DFQ28_009994 [Apophysomyces sp. BC1034]